MKCVAFFRDVLGVTLTIGQTALVRVAIDAVAPVDVEDEAERTAAIAMFGAWSECPEIARRTVNAACGRDSGKTHLSAGIAIYKMVTVDVSRCGPGDTARAIVVSPDVDTSKLTLERAVAMVEGSADLRGLLVGEPTADGFLIRRPDGYLVRFEVRAASRGGRSIRGRSIVFLSLDEAGLFFGESYSVNDTEIIKAARPRLLPGGVIWLGSTPWAAEGEFFRLHEKNHGQPITAIAAQAPTLLMRDNDPDVAANIALEEAEDPDNAAREYAAEFLPTGASQFFDSVAITAAMAVDWRLTSNKVGRAAGADIGLTRDASALAIVAREEARYELVDSEEMRPEKGAPLKLSRVVSSFATVLARHGLDDVIADGHVREPAREFADEHGITISAAPEGASAKYDAYVFLRKLVNEGVMRLPQSARLAAQMRAVRSTPMPGGTWKVHTPRSKALGHCDLLSAFVLATWEAQTASSPLADSHTAHGNIAGASNPWGDSQASSGRPGRNLGSAASGHRRPW